MDLDKESGNFDEWREFNDRSPVDNAVGPARKVEIKGRCMDCWGPVEGLKHKDGRWNHIKCRLCRRAVDGKNAESEAERMLLEAEENMVKTRLGRAAKYDDNAKFVLKILPDMDRDKEQIDRRIEASLKAKPRQGWLGRSEFAVGAPGYLYAQAHASLSALHTLPLKMSAISFSDFEFGEPSNVSVEAPTADAPWQVSMMAPMTHGGPSNKGLMARMGATMVAGMMGAFACEVAMKAISLTRLDQVKKTHDLLCLYKALPEDCRKRVEGDFKEVFVVLEENRHVFGRWRYFEQNNDDAFSALVHTDRVFLLGKAARVIVDECIVAGLQYDIRVRRDLELTGEAGDIETSTKIDLRVGGHEAAIPWDAILTASPDKCDQARLPNTPKGSSPPTPAARTDSASGSIEPQKT